MSGLRRHWIRVDDRWVHYRRGGNGPAVLLLHGSPQSSRALTALAEHLAGRFCVIAPDNPGNGLSDALAAPSEDPADYARACLALMDRLGLERVGVYGFHTGAVIAAAAARLAPARFSAVALDGLPVWTPEERDDLLRHYLPAHPPQWDGGHLWWAWMRMEQQTLYFPWYANDPARRMPGARATPERIHANLIDLLDAGEAYRPLYAAALRADGQALARGFSGPELIFAVKGDPLASHLDRLQPQGAATRINVYPDRGDADGALAAFLAEHPGLPAPTAPQPGADAAGLTRGFVTLGAAPGQSRTDLPSAQALAWRGSLAGAGRPLILLHDAGGSTRLWQPSLDAIAQRRPVLALDLPGHGWSHETPWPASHHDGVDAVAGLLQPAFMHMGLESAALAGLHLGGQIALALQAATPCAGGAAIIGAPHYTAGERRLFSAHYLPRVAVSAEGAHVLRAWRCVRLQAMAFPWFDPRPEAVLRPASELMDLHVLHGRAVDLLKAGANADRALLSQFAYPTRTALRRARAQVMRWPHDPLGDLSRIATLGAQGAGTAGGVVDLPARTDAWAEALAPWRR